ARAVADRGGRRLVRVRRRDQGSERHALCGDRAVGVGAAPAAASHHPGAPGAARGGRSCVKSPATLSVKAMLTSQATRSFTPMYPLTNLLTPGARPLDARQRAFTMKEILFASTLVPTPEAEVGRGADRGRPSDCRT